MWSHDLSEQYRNPSVGALSWVCLPRPGRASSHRVCGIPCPHQRQLFLLSAPVWASEEAQLLRQHLALCLACLKEDELRDICSWGSNQLKMENTQGFKLRWSIWNRMSVIKIYWSQSQRMKKNMTLKGKGGDFTFDLTAKSLMWVLDSGCFDISNSAFTIWQWALTSKPPSPVHLVGDNHSSLWSFGWCWREVPRVCGT